MEYLLSKLNMNRAKPTVTCCAWPCFAIDFSDCTDDAAMLLLRYRDLATDLQP